MDKKLLAGKNSIITGCARGIGRSMLKLFADNGSNVFACVRRQTEEFSSFCDELSVNNNVRIVPVYFDLSDRGAMKGAVKKITGEKTPVDVFVNNAGITYNALFQMSSTEKMHEIFDVNFFAQILL
jgi:3-oxoacyl-[acyl-carrier protein] reductase